MPKRENQSLRIKQPYHKYEKLICKVAWQYANTSGFDFEDLKSEGHLVFMECQASFDRTKGVKFSTYLFTGLSNHFRTMITQNKKHAEMIKADYYPSTIAPPAYQSCMLKDALSVLSKEAQEVIHIIFNVPKELAEEFSDVKDTFFLVRLKEYLMERRKWKSQKVELAFCEITNVISQL